MIYLASTVVLILSIFLSLNIGGSGLTLFSDGQVGLPYEAILQLRALRTAAAFFVGSSLALSGVYLQSLLKNPLAEPYTLGLSGGASLGAVIGVILGLDFTLLAVTAFLGCWGASALVTLVARRQKIGSSKTIILFGIMLSFLSGAVVSLLTSVLNPNKLHSVYSWMIGQVGTPLDEFWWIAAGASALGLLSGILFHRRFDLLLVDSQVLSGISTESQRAGLQIIFLVTLMTSVAVSVAGLIGFIGIIVPHIAKMLLKTSRHRAVVPLAFLVGGTFLILADTLGRSLSLTSEVPAGGITALIGAPFLIYLLFQGKWSQ